MEIAFSTLPNDVVYVDRAERRWIISLRKAK